MVYLIFFISFLVRLFALDQSLWLDEGVTVSVVRNYSYGQIIKNFSPFDFHPPLYYLFLKFWTNFFGYSEISLRLPSVIFSLATGYVIYKIGKLIGNEKKGLWAAIFFLFNPLSIYYSQEARMYMMTTFFTTSLFYFFIKLEKKWQIGKFLFFVLFLILSFYSFYGTIFLILTIFVYLFYKKNYRLLLFSLLTFIFSFLIISPLLYQQWLNSKTSLLMVKNWSLVLGKANLKNLILIPIKFSVGRISFYPKWLYLLVSSIWTSFIFIILFKNLKLKIILIYFFIFPIILGFLVSFKISLLSYFRFLYLLPILCLLLSFAISNKILRSILAIGFVIFSFMYLLNPNFHREDWKSLAYFLAKNNIKEVFMIKSSSDPLVYYNNKIKIIDLKNIDDRTHFLNKERKKIYVIPYSAEIWGIDYKKYLQEKKYKLSFEKSFREIKIEGYNYP